ncbi:hypothetical protein [Bradyrhizobium sp. McL0615]|uniref:hypothetical protein n=1 Tax=Bradyrhizobium sp. McL0615 TaxID=3415673 RepID=UPI003CFBB325
MSALFFYRVIVAKDAIGDQRVAREDRILVQLDRTALWKQIDWRERKMIVPFPILKQRTKRKTDRKNPRAVARC